MKQTMCSLAVEAATVSSVLLAHLVIIDREKSSVVRHTITAKSLDRTMVLGKAMRVYEFSIFNRNIYLYKYWPHHN